MNGHTSPQWSMNNAGRFHRVSTQRFIPGGNEVLRVLVHLLFHILPRWRSWLCTWSMTITVISACECDSLWKWAALGESSLLLCKISEQWPLILQQTGRPVSPMYCWSHLLYVIRYITQEDLQESLIIISNCSPGVWLEKVSVATVQDRFYT